MRVLHAAAILAVLVACPLAVLADGGGVVTPPAGPGAPAPPAAPETKPAPPAGEKPVAKPGAKPAAEPAPEVPAAPRVPGEVLNSGFEQELQGWTVDPSATDSCIADPASAKAGKRSLRLNCARSGVITAVSQEIPLPGEAGRFSVSLWVRPTLGGPSRLAVRVELLDKAKATISRRYLQAIPADARSWEQLSGAVEVPAEAVSARLTLRLVATGALWVDEVKSKFEPAKLLFSTRRLVCVEGQPGKAALKPLIRPATAPTATVDKTDAPVTAQGDALVVDLPALTRGRHTLTLASEGATDDLELWAVPPAHKARQITDNGWWVLAGKSALPSIIMHAVIADVAPVTGEGFSMAQILAPSSADVLQRMFKSIPKLAAPLLVSFGVPSPAKVEDWEANLVHTLRGNASDNRIAGWIVADEPDLAISNLDTPAICLDARTSDSSHPLVLTLTSPDQLDFWHNFADVILINLGYSGTDPARVHATVQSAAAKLNKDQVLGAILPAGWQPGCFQPDLAQARLLAFSAVAGGARCIGWYCLHATGWDLRSTPLWAGMKDLNRDLSILASSVAGHDVAGDVVVEGPAMPWIAWIDGDSRILLAVNAGAEPAVLKVTAGQPIRAASSLVYQAVTEVADGAAQITVKPASVAVVRFGFTAPATPPAAIAPTEQPKPAPAVPGPKPAPAPAAPPKPAK